MPHEQRIYDIQYGIINARIYVFWILDNGVIGDISISFMRIYPKALVRIEYWTQKIGFVQQNKAFNIYNGPEIFSLYLSYIYG